MPQYSPATMQRMNENAKNQKMRMFINDVPIFAAALRYRQMGQHPVPIHQLEKRPLVPWTVYQDRQPTLDEMYGWWSQNQDARVGLITGSASGLVVVDVDPRNGGSLDGIDVPPGALRVATPSGGEHLYFRHPGIRVATRTGVRPGVDVRGDGGLVIAPPSPGYRARAVLRFDTLPAAPSWVYAPPEVRGETGEVDGSNWFRTTFAESTPEGMRNTVATRLAGFLLGNKLGIDATEAILTEWAQRAQPPFPPEELKSVIRSIAARESSRANSGREVLTLRRVTDLVVEEVPFIVDAIIPRGTLTLLYGKDKAGKTLLAQELMAAVLKGQPFLGRFQAVRGGVLALLMDDPPSLIRTRLVTDLGLGECPDLWVATHRDADAERPLPLLAALMSEAMARRPALIVIDALYVLLAGGEQMNQAGGMKPVLREMDRIAEESGAAVVLISHARKADDEAAGSFVIRASAKVILSLSHPPKEAPTRRTLRVESKYIPETEYALDFRGPGQWDFLGALAEVRTEDLENSVLAVVTGTPGLTGEDIAERTQRRKGDVTRALAALAKAGRIESRSEKTGERGRPRETWWTRVA
jgi:hypothetical protein